MLPVEGFAASGANRLKEEVKDGRLETICEAPYAPLNKIDRPIGSVDFVYVNKRGTRTRKGARVSECFQWKDSQRAVRTD